VVVRRCAEEVLKVDVDPDHFIYYVGHERVVADDDNPAFSGLSEWLFAFMARNAAEASDFYHISEDQVVEIGIRIDI
jgi:K+ transporter